MDKYEYRVKTEQMLEYMEKKQYKKAMEIADTIDWRRVKSASMLNSVSEIYEYNGEFQKSRDILFVAFDRSPGSRKIVYRLGTLALKVNDVEEASDCYEEFVKLAPRDPNQYILKYKILRAQGAPLTEQISALEDFKKAEYVEKWAYELAELYHKAGMTAECLEECDDLILWFSEGKYVYKAMELKMKYKPLTPLQQEKYDSRPGAPKKAAAAAAVRRNVGREKTPENSEPEQAETEDEEESTAETSDAAGEEETGRPAPTANLAEAVEEMERIMAEPEEEADEEEPGEEPKKHSAITQVVKGATLKEALANGVAVASGINIEKEAMKKKEADLRITSQMRIDDILQEWEEKQKVNAEAIEQQKAKDEERLQKEREEARRRQEEERREVERKAARAEAERKAAKEKAARKAAEEKAAKEEAARKAAEEEAARKAAEEKAAKEEAERKAAEEKAAKEEAARKAAEEKAAKEEAERKAAEEEAAKKAAEEKAAKEEAARKAAEEKAAKEEAERKAAEEEAARKAAEEKAAKEEAARKAAEEKAAKEEAERKAAEEEAARKAAEEKAAKEEAARKAAEEKAAKEETSSDQAVAAGKTQRIPDDLVKLVAEMEQGTEVREEKEMEATVKDFAEAEDFEIEDDYEEFDDFDEEADDYEEVDYEEEEAEEDFEEEDFEEEDFEEEDFEEEEDYEADDYEEVDYEEGEAEEDFEEEDFEEDDFEADDYEEVDFEEDDFEEGFEEEDFEEEDFEEEELEEEDFEEEELEEEDFEEEELEEEDFEEEEFKEEDFGVEELEIEEPSEEEIQERIKKSKGSGVPFDTGFVVTGRYDLSATSEIGLKAGLTEEQKKLFSYFVPVRGMSEQIVEVLDNDRRVQKEGTSKTGNLLVIGRKGSGKTVLAVDIVKAIQKQRNLKQGKVAIVTGDSLNKKELTNIIQKLRGGAIIIEKAGKLNSRTVKELNHLMEKKTGELLFVLEDQRKPLERMLAISPEFKKKFTSKLELPVFINDELVTFGQTYAKENGYKLDEMGILALYSRIDVMQREDHAVSVAEVKEIMDEAIEHSQKANVKHLARRVFGKGTDDSDRIILKEEDFKI